MENLEMLDFFEDEDLEESEERVEVLEPLKTEELVKDEKDLKVHKEESKKVMGEVERYSSTDISYPCFMLSADEAFPKHVISALSRMIESSLSLENLIRVYIDNKGELLSLGGISSVQVKATIDLLGRDNIEAYFSEGYLLSGDLIYALSE